MLAASDEDAGTGSHMLVVTAINAFGCAWEEMVQLMPDAPEQQLIQAAISGIERSLEKILWQDEMRLHVEGADRVFIGWQVVKAQTEGEEDQALGASHTPESTNVCGSIDQ